MVLYAATVSIFLYRFRLRCCSMNLKNVRIKKAHSRQMRVGLFNVLYKLDENQAQNAYRPHVPGEVLELAFLQERHKPLEGDNAENERHDHAHQKFRREVAGVSAFQSLFWVEERFFRSHALALDPLDAIEECCATDGGDTHEEAEFASVLAVHTHEHHGADGGAAAADARNAGDALHRTCHECSPPVHLDAFVIRVLGAGRAPLRCEKQKAGEKFCNADGARVFEQAFECVLEAEADERCRDAGEDYKASFAELFAVAAEATDDDVRNLLVENYENRKQCACVEHDIEEHACFVHA